MPHFFSNMLERFIQAVRTDDPGLEEPAGTRARLKDHFASGSTRRMTQLGMLVGAAVGALEPTEEDVVVYASGYGESRALEGYLQSLPAPSPTLFQTSIHPSGAQQVLISRQRSMRELFPLSGGEHLAGHALLTALLAPSPRVILCGGEERGTWLLEHGVASDRAFAFALVLGNDSTGALGRVRLAADNVDGSLSLVQFFELIHQRRPGNHRVAPGWRLELSWQ